MPLRLTIVKLGLMDTLTSIEDDRMKDTLGDTEIEVHPVAGLNVRLLHYQWP
jgi:hypothetical protein